MNTNFHIRSLQYAVDLLCSRPLIKTILLNLTGKYVTGGIGIMPNKTLSLDFAYAHGWWKNYGDNYGFNVSRTFQDISTNNFIVTLKYLF
ncbi:MAG: hypothetical protein U5K00_13430 [Melioribacteraceae bacterium]|nr:hypothetical protein [Melioribacteraceae bacterium]